MHPNHSERPRFFSDNETGLLNEAAMADQLKPTFKPTLLASHLLQLLDPRDVEAYLSSVVRFQEAGCQPGLKTELYSISFI